MTRSLLNVEYDELIARAAELEEPFPQASMLFPWPVSNLKLALSAMEQIYTSTENILLYLSAGERECAQLAQSLRNAAAAYDDTDNASASAVTTNTPVPDVTVPNTNSKTPTPVPTLRTDEWEQGDFNDLLDTAQEIEAPDQGIELEIFHQQWTDLAIALRQAGYRFRPFTSWDSEARIAVESNFEEFRRWLNDIADQCTELAVQAEGVVNTQRWALSAHPTSAEIEENFYRWWNGGPTGQARAIEIFIEQEKQSDYVLSEYQKRAQLPLAPINPALAPHATTIDTGTTDDTGLDDDSLDESTSTPPGTGMGLDGGSNADELSDALDNALNDSTPTDTMISDSEEEPQLSPASTGAHTSNDGPLLPLQPAPGSDSLARPAASTLPTPGSPDSGARAPGAGSRMPMMPIGGMGGAPRSDSGKDRKTKESLVGEESLYEEKRPSTEPVVGNRTTTTTHRRHEVPRKTT